MQIGNSQVPYRCFARLIMRWDRVQKKLRVARVCWSRHGGPQPRTAVPDGKPLPAIGYSAALSLALTIRVFRKPWHCGTDECWLQIAFIQLHYQRCYGGWQV